MDAIETMRVFVAVAKAGSFTAAAEQMGTTVQSTSKYVRHLEERLNVQLFDRTTRSVVLNAIGRAYLDRCIDMIDQFDELDALVRQQHYSPKGRIRMTAPTTFGETTLAPILAGFLQKYPDIRLDLNLTNRKIALVEEGYDLGLRISALTDSTLVARKLASMRVVVCASPDYLASHPVLTTPSDLAAHPCIIDTNYKDARHWSFLIDGKKQNVTVDGPFQANTPEAARQMVLAGVGIGMCAFYAVSQDVASGRLEVLFPEHEAYDFGVYAIYPHKRHLSTRVRVLVDYLAEKIAHI